MAGARTAHQAVREFGDALQQALACITTGVLQFGGHSPPERIHTATLNRGAPVALRNALGIDLGLKVSIYYRVPRDPSGSGWRVSTASYLYALTGRDERELLAWHWHPVLEGEVNTAHMHIQSAILNEAHLPFARRHLPTGMIALEDVVRACIEEFGVASRRPDWRDTLRRTREAAGQGAT